MKYFDFQRSEKTFSESKQYRLMCDDLKKELGDARFAKPFMSNCGSDSVNSAERCTFIGEDTFSRLREYSRKSGYTMFEILYSVYMLLYYKLTGDSRFITCTYSSGRENVSCYDTIGYFVKLVLTAVDVDTDETMDSFIAENHKKLINAYGYCSGIAVERLNEMGMHEQESLSHVFVYEKAVDDSDGAPMFVNSGENKKLSISGVEFEKVAIPCTDSQYDIVFMLEECRDDIAFRCHYKESAYSREAVELVMGCYTQLLENILSDTSLAVGKYSTVSERDMVFDNIIEPEKMMFHQYLERYASETPDSIAAIFGEESITYYELDRRSTCLAKKMLDMTGGENTAVGIAVEKSLKFLVSIFAVMKAGGYYVPLDKNYPVERLQYIISDSGMRYLIADGSFDDYGLDLGGADVLRYSDSEGIPAPVLDAKDADVSRRAYCIYTSGSTGRPKGVIVTHSGISTVVEEQTRLFGVVTAVKNGSTEQLICFIESCGGKEISVRKLKDDLRKVLPHYMIPDKFLFTDSWILNNSGKIDRKLLREKAEQHLNERPTELPVTTTEKLVASLLEKAIGNSNISIADTIIELDVNSIMIYDIIADIEEQTGAVFKAHELLRDVTVKELAEMIDVRRSSKRVLLHRPEDETIEISRKQYGIWIAGSMNRGSSEFNIPVAVKLSGELDADALNKAFENIVSDHQILRIKYQLEDGKVTGREVEGHRGKIETEDISHSQGNASVLEKKIQEMKELPLSPDSFPLYKMKLVKTSEKEHYLLFTIHHFIADGWSVRMIFESLVKYYNEYHSGRNPKRENIEYQYSDIVYTEKKCMDEDLQARQEEYWKNKLKDTADEVLSLPGDKKRPAIMTHKGRNVYAQITGKELNMVSAAAAKHGVTAFCLMTAVLGMTLRRCTGQENISVGFPILGRESRQEKQIVGMFIDTAVAKLDVSAEQKFEEYIKAVSREISDTYEMSSVGLNRIIELTDPERTTDNTQLFQVMINMMGFSMEVGGFTGIEAVPVEDGIQEAKYDLTFYISELEDRLDIRLNYYSDVYTEDTARAILDNYLALIRKTVSDDSLTLAEYTPAEAKVLPELGYTKDEDLCAAYFDNLGRTGTKLSIVHKGITYDAADLSEKTMSVYTILKDAGVGSGSTVGIKGARRPEFICALMAILKTGAAYTIIDNQWPDERKDQLLSSANCTHYLESDEDIKLSRLSPAGKTVLPDDCSYISVTSGTTGKPKCIAGHNSAVNHFVRWETDRFALDENDRFAFLSGISHDPIMRDIFVPAAVGAAIVMPDETDIIKVDLFSYLKDGRITVADMTPSIAEVLKLNSEKHIGEKLEDLRYVFFGGEKLRRSCAEAVMELAPNCTIINYYGTTETPQGMAYMEFTRENISRYNDELPVGKGIEDVLLTVADEYGRPCATGETGNVVIRTKYLAKGQIDEDGNIIPLGEDKDVYITGDRGRYLADGSVEILGRNDSQIKRNGHRIAPEEIEAAADRLENVRMSRVVMNGDKLILFIVPDGEPDVEKYTDMLARTLASYMMPDSIVPIESIPLTANGKTDMRALIKASETDAVETVTNNTERSELEEKICIIWGNVLNKRNISVNRTFFETGGSSMDLLILQKELEQYFRRDIPMTELFTYPTIRKFARFIGAAAKAEKEKNRKEAWNDSKDRRKRAGVFMKRAGSKNYTK